MAEAEAEAVAKRFRDLEASQARLREQLTLLLKEVGGGGPRSDGHVMNRRVAQVLMRCGREEEEQEEEEEEEWVKGFSAIRGFFAGGSPYRKVLHHMGHALYVSHPNTDEIIYWNQSAETLFGWTVYEALGRRAPELLMDDQSHAFLEKNVKHVQTWSGLLPFKKKSGDNFLALVTKSLLLDHGDFIGVITVSSDAAVMFGDGMCSERAASSSKDSSVQWRSQPRILSSASKAFSSSSASSDTEGGNSYGSCEISLEKLENLESEKTDTNASKTFFGFQAGRRIIEAKANKFEEAISKFSQRSNMAAKMFSKFQISGSNKHEE